MNDLSLKQKNVRIHEISFNKNNHIKTYHELNIIVLIKTLLKS